MALGLYGVEVMEPDWTRAVDDPNSRGEKQKDTTDAYREGWNRIYSKPPLDRATSKPKEGLRFLIRDNKS